MTWLRGGEADDMFCARVVSFIFLMPFFRLAIWFSTRAFWLPLGQSCVAVFAQPPAALAASDWTIQVTRACETMPPPLALEFLRYGYGHPYGDEPTG